MCARRPAAACWLCLLAALGGSTGVGCNSGKQMQRDLYVRELRLQEDEIYRLEDCIEEYQAIIRGMRLENEQLRSGASAPADAGSASRGSAEPIEAEDEPSLLDDPAWSPDRPSTPPAPPTPLPDDDLPERSGAPEIELPEIDSGDPAEAPTFAPPPAVELPPASPLPAETPKTLPVEPDANAAPLPPLEEPSSLPADQPAEPVPAIEAIPLGDPLSQSPRPGESEVTTAALDSDRGPLASPPRELADPPPTEGWPPITGVVLISRPGPPEPAGEATLLVQSQALAADGDATVFQGEVSLMLRDPLAPGGAAELARWDYSADEVAASWSDPETAPGLDFVLVLPDGLPNDRPLELWIRLVDRSGRKAIAKVATTLDSPAILVPPNDAAPLPPAGLGASPSIGAATVDRGWSPRGENPVAAARAPTWRRAGAPEEALGSEVRLANFQDDSGGGPERRDAGDPAESDAAP